MTSTCDTCHSPLAPEQRYCLQCGARQGTPRVGEQAWPVVDATAEAVDVAPKDPVDELSARPPRSRALPAAIAAGTLAVGVFLGVALGPSPDATTAAGSSPYVLLGDGAPPTAAPAAATTADDTVADDAVDDTVTPDASVDTSVTADTVTDTSTSTSTDTSTTDDTDDTSDEDPVGDDDGGLDLGDLAGGDPAQPAIDHVWVISLSGQDQAALFGATSTATYLRSLVPQGVLLSRFTPVSRSPLASGVALLSGQPPNTATEGGCPQFVDVAPATVDDGIATGTGCVYPTAVGTLPNALATAKKTWKAYVQRQGTACRRPTLGEADPWQAPTAEDPYRTTRNPFVYFHALTDTAACTDGVVDLTALPTDLGATKTTPSVSWIVPDAEHDGGAPVGVAGADAFLQDVVPKITATSAYKAGGMIVIAPDSPAPGAAGTAVAATGALVLSPLARTGATSKVAYDQYGLLRSLANLFDLDDLGRSGDDAAKPFGDDVYLKVATDGDGGSTETL